MRRPRNAFRAAQQFASGRPAARFYIGFDLGQKSSFSAVATLELVRGGRSTIC